MGKRIREQQHRLRKSLKEPCIVCGAEKFFRCYDVQPHLPSREWAEFKLLAAVHDLKEVDPDHVLVRAIEATLMTVPPDNPHQLTLDFGAEER
jgi:hypothetical protein